MKRFFVFLVLFASLIIAGCSQKINKEKIAVNQSPEEASSSMAENLAVVGQNEKIEKLGIFLVIPEFWIIESLSGNEKTLKISPKDGDVSFDVYVNKLTDEKKDIIDVLAEAKDTSASWFKNFLHRQTKINGFEAVIFDEIDEYKNAPVDVFSEVKKRKEVFIKTEKGVYSLSYIYKDKNEEIAAIFDDIVGSFKFSE